MNCKLHTQHTFLLASISFLIFLDAGEDSSLLGLLVLGPKGDHHGEVWLHTMLPNGHLGYQSPNGCIFLAAHPQEPQMVLQPSHISGLLNF